jgi:hypothetical protein
MYIPTWRSKSLVYHPRHAHRNPQATAYAYADLYSGIRQPAMQFQSQYVPTQRILAPGRSTPNPHLPNKSTILPCTQRNNESRTTTFSRAERIVCSSQHPLCLKQGRNTTHPSIFPYLDIPTYNCKSSELITRPTAIHKADRPSCVALKTPRHHSSSPAEISRPCPSRCAPCNTSPSRRAACHPHPSRTRATTQTTARRRGRASSTTTTRTCNSTAKTYIPRKRSSSSSCPSASSSFSF